MQLKRTCPLLPRAVLSLVLLCSLVQPPALAAAADKPDNQLNDAVIEKTVAVLSKVPGLTQQQLEAGRQVFRGMDYNCQRATRKISLLPGATFSLCQQSWELLKQHPLSFEQLVVFEKWADLPGAAAPRALEALTEISQLARTPAKTFRAWLNMNGIRAEQSLDILPLFKAMKDAHHLAARELFTIKEMDVGKAMNALAVVQRCNNKQAWAFAAFAAAKDMDSETAFEALPLIRQMREDDAWNMRIFIKQKKPDRGTAWSWLVRYFAHPVLVQEEQYYRMNRLNRTALLDAFYQAGEEVLWRVNNLHAVTDEYGREYSQARLNSMSADELQELFDRLSEKTKVNYGGLFDAGRRSGQQSRMVFALRRATTVDRTQVAEDLTSANIYALLAQGSDLYDSSFRDILVPILKERIRKGHQNNLLVFLNATDPANQLVSSFIVSLAQKGKLTDFFPASAAEQQKILQLVAASAFKDEDAILLFSATFRHLLIVLEPSARSYLIQKMVAADSGKGSFSKLITVILQYYLQEYPELLSKGDQELIRKIIARNGAVNLDRYLTTPFGQWKEDGQLGSISVFHPDDDGRESFVSNARTLDQHGYAMTLSKQYTLSGSAAAGSIVAQVSRNKGFGALFDAMRDEPFSVAFVKKVNGIAIRHAVCVYRDADTQEQVIKRFLKSGDEMFAQRGHSYWRTEQLTDPLAKLQKEGQITDRDLTARQRFMSLGSCGGVKVYTKLNRLFLGHVDIMATIGTGIAMINDPYNANFFEIVAKNPSSITWQDMADKTAFIFGKGRGQDYLQPGCLTSILHKILDEDMKRQGIKPKDEEEDLW